MVRPDKGHCPADIGFVNDVTVTYSTCNLFLCKECYNFSNLPTEKVSDNTRHCTPLTTINTDAKVSAPICSMRNELLYFVQQKCDVLAADQLVKLDLCQTDETISACLALKNT